jgi:molybdopterin-guanine dinucleotide biosynthesis protein A
MGGVDKGLQLFHGMALIEHAIERIKRQTFGTPGLIGLNANRNQQQYAQWGLPVWSDLNQEFAGPLAGFQAALGHCHSNAPHISYLLMIPCDSPLFPLDLLKRMSDGLTAACADVAVAVGREDGSPTMRRQPVFCLMRTSVLESLTALPTAPMPFLTPIPWNSCNTLQRHEDP